MTERAAPILPARDVSAAVAFYGRLGFTAIGVYAEPDPYAILRRGDIELHFWEDRELDPARNAAGCYLRLDDADTAHAQWVAAGIGNGPARLAAPEDKPWGMREFTLIDPDGNLLRIGTPLPPNPG